MVYDHSRRPEPQPQRDLTSGRTEPSPYDRQVRQSPEIEQRNQHRAEIKRQRDELGITPIDPNKIKRVSPEKYKMTPALRETIQTGGVNEGLMDLQARIDFLRANPDQQLSLNNLASAKVGPKTQTPQRIAQTTPGQTANPVAQFQQDLNRNALTRIQNNRDCHPFTHPLRQNDRHQP